MSTTIIREYHFTYGELSCKCGCGKECTDHFIDMLEALRVSLNTPLTVTSGARCKSYNEKVGGVSNSNHIKGIAADISCDLSRFRRQLIATAINIGFTGIGIAKTFIHLDIRPADEALIFLY